MHILEEQQMKGQLIGFDLIINLLRYAFSLPIDRKMHM